MSNFFSSKLFTVLSFVLVGFLGFFVLQGRPEIKELNNEIADLEKKVLEAEDKVKTLESEFDFFKSDSYLERQARLKLNLKNPNEFVAYIVRDDNVSSISEEDIKDKSILEKALDFIFKRD